MHDKATEEKISYQGLSKGKGEDVITCSINTKVSEAKNNKKN